MARMKAMRWIGFFSIVIAVTAAVSGWRTVNRLRAENEALRAELRILKDQHAAAAETASVAHDQELQRLRADAQEVLRLRGEVTQLRSGAKETEKLRGENQQLRAENQQMRTVSAANTTPSASDVGKDLFKKESWNFAGYASPEAALVSAIWSMKEGNPKTYLDSVSPEEQARMAKVWENKTEAEIAAKHQADVSTISAFRILEQHIVNDNEVQMNVYIEGVGRMEKVSMKRMGSDWKFGGFIRPPPK
jgi:hypothetical protein